MIGDDLVFVIPLLWRTRNIDRVYGAVRATTPGARVLFIASADDPKVLAELDLLGLLTDRNALIVEWEGGSHGDYARKINAGYRASTEPFIFTGADDVVPHAGWYDVARALMVQRIRCDDCGAESELTVPDDRLTRRRFPLPEDFESETEAVFHDGCSLGRGFGIWAETSRIAVVGTRDLCNPRVMKGLHSTHSLVARWYADRLAVVDTPGAIYSEEYAHEWCDDELIRTAMWRGAFSHSDAVVEHLHVDRDPMLIDATYRRGRAASKANRKTFMRRRHLWGDGTPPSAGGNYRRPRVARRI